MADQTQTHTHTHTHTHTPRDTQAEFSLVQKLVYLLTGYECRAFCEQVSLR